MAAAEIPRPLLGQLLVEGGVISGDQLEQALAEQQTSGRLLGEVIVAQGFASRHDIARALAEQAGLDLDQELGFGSGLLEQIQQRREAQPKETPDGQPGLAGDPAPVAGGYELLRVEPDPGEEPAAERERDLELDRLRGALEEHEAALTRATGESAELRRRLEAREQELAVLEQALQNRERARAEPHSSHLVFAPRGGGYELLERPGPPPDVGESLAGGENGDRRFLVAKVARSPLPLDPRACAYVHALN